MRYAVKGLGVMGYLVAIGLTAWPARAAADGPELAELTGRNAPWAKGERVVFFGDSITAAGNEPGGFVRTIDEALKKDRPDLALEIINAGVGGHRASDLFARLQGDVLDRKPNVVFILVGVNDVGVDVTAKDYESSLRAIVSQLQKAGATVVLGTPILRGEKTDNTNPKDGPMNEFTGVCQRICEDTGAKFCNLRAAAQAYLKDHNKENAEKGILTSDGVHLTADGNRLVAEKAAQAIAEALRLRAMQQWIGPGHGLATWDGADVPFKQNDKIIFFGDSITSGATSPNGYITVLGRELRAHHPELPVQLVNKGNSGNKVPNLQSRLHSDVLSQKPNVLFIYIGINDVWHETAWDGSGTPTYAFQAGLRHIIEKARARGATVVLATPSVIGEKTDGTNELDKQLDEYAKIGRDLAQEMGVTVCDLRQAFMDYLKQANPENNERGILTVDRVHLNDLGNLLVAHKAAEAIQKAVKK